MRLLPCPLPCHKNKESQSKSHSNHHLLQSESSSSSFSSLLSLPSVPSLTSPLQQQHEQQSPTTHYHHCLATLKLGHSSYISSLALSGEFLYSGSSNSEIRAWNRNNISLQSNSSISTDHNNIVATGTGAVKSLVISGDKLFSAHQDHKIRIWKINNNESTKYENIATLPTLNDRFIRCFSAKNYIEVRRHKKSTWVHHVDTVSSLAISSDGSLLYSASWDRSFKIWKTTNFRCVESVNHAHDDAINALVLSNDGFVYTGSADKKIKVWKKLHPINKNHSLVATLEKHKSAVNALALSSDGSVLYSGACDRSVLVWERSDVGSDQHMLLIGALRGHTKAILCLVVVADLVCSGSADNKIRVWRKGDERCYDCIAVLEGHRRPVKCLTAVVNGGGNGEGNSYMVYSGSLDCDIKIWELWVPFS